MGRVTLYTGGARSGKSRLAMEHAARIGGEVCFVATCVPQDKEMEHRVEKHRADRPAEWRVIEEPVDIAAAIESVDAKVHPAVLVDCLTLWVCNLMCQEDSTITCEEAIAVEAKRLADSAAKFGGDVIFVTNEVGMGIIPANEMSRAYADMAGRCNQIIATAADTVVFVSCGIPITLKGAE